MTGPHAAILPCGRRLHLQHGPIDLVIGADGDRARAFQAARDRFETVLAELMDELDALRAPVWSLIAPPTGETALRMHHAAQAFSDGGFLTPMAAVAGAVAETVLDAMVRNADLHRAYVNNGGDVALHLSAGARFGMEMQTQGRKHLGNIANSHGDPIRGVATSGRGGRSLSLGIADSVTVLARSAAEADVSATLIANAVDLPAHPAIRRQPAYCVRDDSDLGDTLVVTGCGWLAPDDRDNALDAGMKLASKLMNGGRIIGASLHLQGNTRTIGGCGALMAVNRAA